MVDKFNSMTELISKTTKGIDWEIITKNRSNPIIVTAVHGGAIERGTSELAACLSELGNFKYYTFKGVRKNKNNELHVTSRHFNEPVLVEMIQSSQQAISIHGCMGDYPEVYIGGRDKNLIQAIKTELNRINVIVKDAPRHISGLHADNFVNCCTNGEGVQLELTVALRKRFFKNRKYALKDREDKSNWDDFMYQFSNAIMRSIQFS
ncbi:poly-gamma-glutamate hydrolase family protein [Staphylococcus sp. ACRSN]|uniref:poly-gamma-glutamate hydrolase family protein n=1 Tax=Staphylococcus sp. ACRSN TaxID=2918214 RepID=UPI001EF33F7A|nr:poly-gamma-glutamate hydrolase family protein [Staphylococcus sp. ACRSN]MCG7339590.1 poly-gamma-glutamate hydrolase family protein [Staphylococcus sp. ACRSN]